MRRTQLIPASYIHPIKRKYARHLLPDLTEREKHTLSVEWWRTHLPGVLSSKVSFADRSAMFHRMRLVRKAPIIMFYVDWRRGLVSLVHAFFSYRICPHITSIWTRKIPASSWSQSRHWHRFQQFIGRIQHYFDTSNSWSPNENGFSAFSLLRSCQGTASAQTCEVILLWAWSLTGCYTWYISQHRMNHMTF